VFEHEKTVTITKDDAPWAAKEELGDYKITRWRWYDKQRSLSESAKVVDAKRDKAQLDIAEYYVRMVKYSVTPPDALSGNWTPERIRDLDPHVGEILIKHAREINGLTWEEKVGFLEQSDQKETTRG